MFSLRKIKSVFDLPGHLAELRHLMYENLSPVDKYCALRTRERFTGDYEQWRVNRIRKVIEILGSGWEWSGKRVLELGCAFGDIGAFFADAGADVLSVDGRIDNLSVAKLRYRHLPSMRFEQRNLEEEFSSLGRFDVILHFGLLYHIDNVDRNLRTCAAMSDRIFLETEVLDSTDPCKIVKLEEDVHKYDTGLSGSVTMISPFYVKRTLEDSGFSVEIIRDRALNAGPHVYDWTHVDDETWVKNRRRFFYARSGETS